jgi:uncharacterized protein (UPF0548 family)
MTRDLPPASELPFSYGHVGITAPSSERWAPKPQGRLYERSFHVGSGDTFWQDACRALLSWEVKTRSGFELVATDSENADVAEGCSYWIRACVGPFHVYEPVRVVEVIQSEYRVGFSYGTLTGHPVCGEEAFIVERNASGSDARLTLRSFTEHGAGRWALMFPAALIAQRFYRYRYSRCFKLYEF